nr:hypothetical protein CFP56_11422 [Quercus suber]
MPIPVRAFRPVPQHVLPQLARARLGQLVEHLDLARHHELGDAALGLGPADEVGAGELAAAVGLERDEGLGPLAPLRVGDGDARGLEHGRVGDEHGLERERGDVLAAGDDDVLGAVEDLDRAVRVPDGEVAAVLHAAREQLARRGRVLVVAARAQVAHEHDLADLAAVLGHVHDGPVHRGPRPALVLRRLDHARRERQEVAVSLPGHLRVSLLDGEGLPGREMVAFGDGPVGLRQPVYVHGMQVEVFHGLEEMRGRGRGGDRHSNRFYAWSIWRFDGPDEVLVSPGSFSAFASAQRSVLTVGAAQ